jgi:hypothetical protein
MGNSDRELSHNLTANSTCANVNMGCEVEMNEEARVELGEGKVQSGE